MNSPREPHTSFDLADTPQGQHFDSGFPAFEPGRERQRGSLSGKLSEELAEDGIIILFSHGLLVSTGRPLAQPLTWS